MFRSKINNTFIGNGEDLDIVMPIYNLLEYNNNYSMISWSLWNYYRHENNENNGENSAYENNGANSFRINNNKTTSKSFEFKTKLKGSTPSNGGRLDAEVFVPLK